MNQAEFIDALRTATDHLFAHRKMLQRARVRIGFWPEGMVISCMVPARTEEELQANVPEVIPWERLHTVDPSAMIEAIDRVCARHHQLIGARGTA